MNGFHKTGQIFDYASDYGISYFCLDVAVEAVIFYGFRAKNNKYIIGNVFLY